MVPHLVIPPNKLDSILCVGFRDKASTTAPGYNREHLDVQFLASNPSVLYDKYKWMFPSNTSVNNATLRFNKPIEVSVDGDAQGATFRLLMELYAPLLDNCSVLEPSQVKYNGKSSTGPSNEYEKLKFKDFVFAHPHEFNFTWLYAHALNLPMYWKASGKVEMLKASKIAADDCRTFMFPDAQHRYCGQRMCQDFNNQMGALKGHWSKIGFDRTHGGFSSLMQDLENEFKIFFEGDCTKWDARMAAFLLYVCMMLRWVCYKPEFRTLDNWKRLVYQYTNKIRSLIFLPSGQLLLLPHGNKSGQDSTSYDNTIAHSYVFLDEMRILCMKHGIEPTLLNIQILIFICLYGDDSLGAMTKECETLILMSYPSIPAWLDQMYTRFGMQFKLLECKVQDTVIGLKFIGGIAKSTPYGIAHTFSVDRALSAMVRYVDKPKPDAFWSKWTSLLALLAFEPERECIREHMRSDAATRVDGPKYIPTDFDLYTFWFGWERATKSDAVKFAAITSAFVLYDWSY